MMASYSLPGARPLPVILLADVSGSMSVDGKIEALNDAISDMIHSFAEGGGGGRTEIHVSVVTFGGKEAQVHQPLRPATGVAWQPMEARGGTPLGHALRLTREMVEDRELVPKKAYRPTIVLVSDGQPTDEWEGPLEELLKSERGAKAYRFAMAIGADCDTSVLKKFLHNPENHVFEAHQARTIRDFFREVTMTVTQHSFGARFPPQQRRSFDDIEEDDF